MGFKKEKMCCGYAVFCGVMNIIAGIVIYVGFGAMVLGLINDSLKIKPSDYDAWAGTKKEDAKTVPVYYTLNFWNLTNLADFKNGQRPVFQEVGPYYYRYRSKNFNVSFSSDNSRVRFQSYKYFTFDRKKTPAQLDPAKDRVNMVNPFYAYANTVAGGEQNLAMLVADGALRSAFGQVLAKPNTTAATVAALWTNSTGGAANLGALTLPFPVPLATATELVNVFLTPVGGNSGLLVFFGLFGNPALTSNPTMLQQAFQQSFPASTLSLNAVFPLMQGLAAYVGAVGQGGLAQMVAAGQTGLVINRTPQQILFGNMDMLLGVDVSPFSKGESEEDRRKMAEAAWSDDYIYRTGMDNTQNIEFIERYAGVSVVPYWKKPIVIADQKGRDGTRFGNHLKRKWSRAAKERVFTDALWRAVDLLCTKDVELHGVKLHRYEIAPYDMAANDDYYNKWTGVANMTGPSNGIPLFASRPHLLGADAAVQAMSGGMAPKHDEHELYIDIEPITGLALNAHKRLQQNALIYRSKFPLTMNATFPNDEGILMPWFWADQNAALTEEVAKDLKKVLYGIKGMLRAALGVLVAIGGVLIIVGIVGVIYFVRKSNAQTMPTTAWASRGSGSQPKVPPSR